MNFFSEILSSRYLYIIPAALLSIIFHELCHGYVAYRLGDPTAKAEGRLTLNPLKHIDLIGLLMLIFFRFGWAKPVHVDMRYFKKPKRDMALVAVAGPASNFILAIISILILCIFAYTGVTTEWLIYFFSYMTLISLGLGIFNLIPIPPLDGSKILGAFMSDRAYYTLLHYERYGMLLLIAALYLGWLNYPLINARLYSAYYLLYGISSPFPSDVFNQVLFQLFPELSKYAGNTASLAALFAWL